MNRREFINATAGAYLSAKLMSSVASAQDQPKERSSSVSSHGPDSLLLPLRNGCYEASLFCLSNHHVGVLYGGGQAANLHMRLTEDRGKTWTDPKPMRTAAGQEIPGCRVSPVRLKSGAVGIVYTGPAVRAGRDGTLLFRTSTDEGQTWSEATAIDPVFACVRNGCARVLRTGRIVAPTFIWISPYAGGESESETNSVCFSWVYYSDDEGQTWKRSLSELIVSKDQGRGGYHSFEEPALEELRDGRVLMYGRTELGRQFVTTSSDGGVVWKPPTPSPLASSYTPTLLQTIPKTGDLLAIWNQASEEEILAGLPRHRLSSAISKDDGVTWERFRNLESLDDVTKIEPPPAERMEVIRMKEYAFRQPTDRQRYHRAPGPLRVCYPSVAFVDDQVLVTYDYPNVETHKEHGTKLQVLPLDWFYRA